MINLPATASPLVIMLHGGGGTSENVMNGTTEGRWNELADADKFIVVYPQGWGNNWNDCRDDYTSGSYEDDVGFISALIDYFYIYYNIDTQRIYAAGHSNGGMMSFRLAIELSGKIADVFSSAGSMAAVNNCSASENSVAIMYLAGTADPIVPYEGGPLTLPSGTNHGSVLSVRETIDYWVEFLKTDRIATIELIPDIVPDDDSSKTSHQSILHHYLMATE